MSQHACFAELRLMCCLLPQLISTLSDSSCANFCLLFIADYIILAVKANYSITVSVALFPFSRKKYLPPWNPKSLEAPQATRKQLATFL